ncbi:hypothetical protein [Methanothermobacter wolfeii]|nr:hypothetical protein [Methanothermobacter wolfeii]
MKNTDNSKMMQKLPDKEKMKEMCKMMEKAGSKPNSLRVNGHLH